MNDVFLNQSMATIKKYQNTAPVNLLAIAKELNLKIFEGNPVTPSISGKIVKDHKTSEETSYSIYVNANDAPVRKRFTIAHEMAHFLLHRDKIGDGLVDDALYRSGLKYNEEAEANKLAAQILMPWDLINNHMNENSTVQSLARAFAVSESAMAIRLGIPC